MAGVRVTRDLKTSDLEADAAAFLDIDPASVTYAARQCGFRAADLTPASTPIRDLLAGAWPDDAIAGTRFDARRG